TPSENIPPAMVAVDVCLIFLSMRNFSMKFVTLDKAHERVAKNNHDIEYSVAKFYSGFMLNLPFAICHLPFAICHLPFAICHLPFAICHLPFAICHFIIPSCPR